MAKSKPPVVANGKATRPLSPLDVLTLTEAAAYLRLPEDAVREEAEAGRLVGRHVRGEWRFARESIVMWLQAPVPRSVPRRVTAEETQEEYEAFLVTASDAAKSGSYAEE